MATSSKSSCSWKAGEEKSKYFRSESAVNHNNCNFPCYVSRCHHFPWRRFPKRSELI